MKIAVDAGHGYNTAGKRTPAGEREWSFNNKNVLAFIKEISKYENVEVLRVDDPTGNTDIGLTARTDKANAWGADIYISFHHNANLGTWGTWTGTETYIYTYPGEEATRLADLIHPAILQAYGLKDRGIKKANFAVLRQTKMPAVLIESGYMDSSIDIVKLRNDNVLAQGGINAAKAAAVYGGLKLKPIPVPVAPKPVAGTYTVQSGDTLWGISQEFDISVDELKAKNGLTDNVIHVGQVLKVSNATYHTVVAGDTLWGISRDYGVSVADIKNRNGLTSDIISVGQELLIK
jgi:N-acetylmuramoyl-L-alanine amidase